MKNVFKCLLIMSCTFSSVTALSSCKSENDLEKQTEYDDSRYKGNAEVQQRGNISQHPEMNKAKQ